MIHAKISWHFDAMTRTLGRVARAATAVVAMSVMAASAHGAEQTVAPLLDGMGTDRGPVASQAPLAQKYFHQGVALTWGFNPVEAARSFEAATRADPRCALCWWGLAWAQGPNINSDMAADASSRVQAALAKARALTAQAPRRTRALIDALSVRHSAADPAQPPAEEAYLERMRALTREYPHDADIATLAAEAALNLHPYDWWDAHGAPRPWTPETIALLTRAMTITPGHPGANHYWIHLMESSPHPEKALSSAGLLETAVPGSGHLLHMPAHIYMRVGRYADAVAANEKSIAADKRYLEQVDAQRAYRVGYVAHNQHFLWAAAAMEGRSAEAIAAARAAWPAACGARRIDRSTGLLQHYYVLPLYALVRFGRWREILDDTLPPDVAEPYALAIWHYARGTALARTGRTADARRELADVARLAQDPALARTLIKNINPALSLVKIAALTLTADIDSAEGRAADAVAPLVAATKLEDALSYDEPHLWIAPTRQALGAALLAAGHPADAERVYREDLRHYPDNGWSLIGLAQAQRQLGNTAAANDTEARARAAWSRADIPLTASRL